MCPVWCLCSYAGRTVFIKEDMGILQHIKISRYQFVVLLEVVAWEQDTICESDSSTVFSIAATVAVFDSTRIILKNCPIEVL